MANSGKRLLKALERVAAKELKNTRGISPRWGDKAELVEVAHGFATVVDDFAKWAESVRDVNPEHPISEYLKIVDERLGNTRPEVIENPFVNSIIARVYKLTGRPATKASINTLLADFSGEEILDAFTEYASRLEDTELQYSVKNFFHDGGASGIILARRENKEARDRLQAQEDAAVAASKDKWEKEDAERQRRKAEEKNVNPFGD